jgi:hypothetical protein
MICCSADRERFISPILSGGDRQIQLDEPQKAMSLDIDGSYSYQLLDRDKPLKRNPFHHSHDINKASSPK